VNRASTARGGRGTRSVTADRPPGEAAFRLSRHAQAQPRQPQASGGLPGHRFGFRLLDRDVVAPDQIRTILATFRDRMFTEIFPGRTDMPKPLIFAKNDSLAGDVVGLSNEITNPCLKNYECSLPAARGHESAWLR